MKKNEKSKIYCPKCGKELTDIDKFCSGCGYEFSKKENAVAKTNKQISNSKDIQEAPNNVPTQNENIKSIPIFKRWYFWLIVVLAILLITILSLFIASQTNNGSIPVPGQNNNIVMPENQGKVLPGGTYTIGEDLPAGRYSLMYTTTLDNKKYWPNDYFYITRSGSEGEQKTLGGTTYDERLGAVPFEEASKGKSSFVNLKSGDKIIVESKYGTWTY